MERWPLSVRIACEKKNFSAPLHMVLASPAEMSRQPRYCPSATGETKPKR